jgi:hypothetical protein
MPKTLSVLAFCLVMFSCNPTQEKPIPPPNPPPDTNLCERMCNHLASPSLNCDEGKPVYNSDLPGPVDIPNQSCKDWCIEMQDKGVFINPRCVALVTTCGDIEPYRQKDPTTCELTP